MNFNDEFYLDQDFTSDINKLRQALEKVESRGGTALYDALVASWSDYLKKDTKLPKKVIFVVTDGEDNASRSTLERLSRVYRKRTAPRCMPLACWAKRKKERPAARCKLWPNGLAESHFCPRPLVKWTKSVKPVAHDIRSQYTIGYKPTTPKSAGGYRSIHVDAIKKR